MAEDDKQTRLSPKKVQEDLTKKLDAVVDSTNAVVGDLQSSVSAIDVKMEAILNAINNPVAIRKHTEADEQELGATSDIDGNEIESSRFSDVDLPEFNEKAKMLSFMNEKVTVVIHETSDKNADGVFDISVNGRPKTFVRGHEFTVKRIYVEGLARAKPVHYDNKEYVDGDGVRKVRNPSRKGLRYPFAVVEDSNPVGRRWLKMVLAQP